MKKISALLGCLLLLLSACNSQEATPTPVDVSALQTLAVQTFMAGVNQTAAANVPTDTPTPTDTPELPTAIPTLPIPTNTPIKIFVPLYWEVTWENLGRSEKELMLDEQGNERVTLSGYTYQTPQPSEQSDLLNNVRMYYSPENMASMGWMVITGWGGTTGVEMEFYNKSGYFLTVRFVYGQSRTLIIWISDETTIVPVLPST